MNLFFYYQCKCFQFSRAKYISKQWLKRYMAQETVVISKEEYMKLKQTEKVDQELLQDIARGIKDILQGKVKEV